AVEVDLENRAWGRLPAVLSVLCLEAREGALELRSSLERSRSAVQPDPPEPRPVVLVVIHQDRHPWIGGRVLQAAPPGAPFGLAVDGRVQYVGVEHETEWNHVWGSVATDGGQPCHRSRRDPRAHFLRSHDQIVRWRVL